MSKSSFVVELFERIHGLKVQNEQNKYLYRLKRECPFLLFTIFFLCLIQCHTRIYNASAGLFYACSSYSPYITYLFGGLLLCFLMKFLFDLFQFLWFVFINFQLIISLDAQHTLNMSNIGSIRWLDYLLMTTAKENNYRNRLFLIHGKYLVIFKIDLSECDPKVLCQFYTTAPFMIIDVARIVAINSNYISILNDSSLDKILLPKINDSNNNDITDWLHKRLIDCSAIYRLEKEKRHRLAALINEEEEIQRRLNPLSSVSFHVIAQFRLEGAQIVNTQLPEITCAICLETLQLGDFYSQ
jgi:hypothetical protein